MDYIDPDKWFVRVSEDGSWQCDHVDAFGRQLPSTILNIRDAADAWPQAPADDKRYKIACPDCATWWRIGAKNRVACYYVAPPFAYPPVEAKHPNYLQPVRRDIHTVIDEVRKVLPACSITQEAMNRPGTSDDGIWYFELPGMNKHVHIESYSGMCPFIAETVDWSSGNARTFHSVEEAAAAIVAYLTAVSTG